MKKVVVLFVLVFGLIRTASASADQPADETGESQTYLVQWGDRLPRVAAQFGLTQEELLAANPRSAYGMSCGNPHTVTLRNGERQALCGRPRPYLIAGKTLVIPVPRATLQTESVRLNAEVVALRMEMAQLRKARETEKSELAALAQERDNLRSENESLVAAKAELQGKYSESQADFQAVFSRQPKQVEVQKTNFNHIALAVAITAFVFVLIILAILSRKGKNEKKFDRLVRLVQPSVLEQAEKNKQRGAELDQLAKELNQQKRVADDLQAKLQEQKSEQERLDNDLATREVTLKREQEELATVKRAVEGREAFCTRRDDEIHEAERGLLERSEAFRGHVRVEEERLRTESAAVARGKEELLVAQRDLEEKRAQVETGLRTLEEDSPAIQRDREEADRRIREAETREESAKRAAEDAAQRVREAETREAAATRQTEEAESRKGAADEAERILARREEEVGGREEELHRLQDQLRQERTDFEGQLGAAEHTLEAAGGLEKAKRIISRAKRKEEIVAALDKREAAIADREEVCAHREHELALWAAQLGALEDDTSDGEETVQRLTLGVDDTFQDAAGSITCAACGGKFPDRGAFDAHKANCPKAAPHTPTIVGAPAGGRASVVAPPPKPAPSEPDHSSSASCEPDTVYCQYCKEGFPPDVYAAEHAAHDEGLAGKKG